MMHDELKLLDEERIIALENIICQKGKVVRHYNKKVKIKSFRVGDLVWKVIYLWIKSLRYMENGHQIGMVHMLSKRFSQEIIMQLNTDNYIGLINGKYLKTYKPVATEIKISITKK